MNPLTHLEFISILWEAQISMLKGVQRLLWLTKEWTMNHYFWTSGHSLVNFVFLRNTWILCLFFFFKTKHWLKKKRTQNRSLLEDKSVSLLDKMFTKRINSEWLAKKSFLLQTKCLLSCQKKTKKTFLHF